MKINIPEWAKAKGVSENRWTSCQPLENEIFVSVKDERFKDEYYISNFGRLIQIEHVTPKGRMKSPHIITGTDVFGYARVYLSDRQGGIKSAYIHRLVADAFLDNHLLNKAVLRYNNDRDDNRLSNLYLADDNTSSKSHSRNRRIKCLEDEAEFNTAKECSDYYGIPTTTIYYQVNRNEKTGTPVKPQKYKKTFVYTE